MSLNKFSSKLLGNYLGKYLVAISAVALLSACSENKKPETNHAPDHTILKVSEAPAWDRPTDCRANIKTAICLADPLPENSSEGDTLKRTCLPGSESYAIHFERLYDAYPPAYQKMFCSLRKIFVERNFYATAYAGSIEGPKGELLPGAYIGIRQSLLDTGFSLSHWSTWKEQLNFGGDPKSYVLKMEFPKMEVAGESGLDFMYFVFAHEFGHLFDFKNGVNQFVWDKPCVDGKAPCKSVVGTWSDLAWMDRETHRLGFGYAYSDELCFYSCKETMSQEVGVDLYRGLRQSGFISNYAATNPWDDFAETLGYYVLNRTLKKPMMLTYSANESFDATARIDSPEMKVKLDYVEQFLANSPQYP